MAKSNAAFDEVGVEEYYSDKALERYSDEALEYYSDEALERLGVDLCTNETKWYVEDYLPFTIKVEDEDEWQASMFD